MTRIASGVLPVIVVILSLAANADPAHSRHIDRAPVMFTALPRGPEMHYSPGHQPIGQLAQWEGGFTDLTGKSVTYTMAGADPATSNTATTIPVVIIPVVVVYGASNGNMTFDPRTANVNGNKNVIQNLLASPLFDYGHDFVSGSVDLGQTQYTDAHRRGNFWSIVSTNSSYHTVLEYTKVKGLKPLIINVTPQQGAVYKYIGGSSMFGDIPIGIISASTLGAAIDAYVRRNNTRIMPNILPLFASCDVLFPYSGGYGAGFHSALGKKPTGQTYAYSTYTYGLTKDGDVGGFAHELGEWMDDPFVDNKVNCTDNTFLEVADPLDRLPDGGNFPVALNGFTYHLQSLVYLPYFGAPASMSANGWIAFNNDITNVCPGQ